MGSVWMRPACDLAQALKRLVNAPLPKTLDPEEEFWIAARLARATLDTYSHLTRIDGEPE